MTRTITESGALFEAQHRPDFGGARLSRAVELYDARLCQLERLIRRKRVELAVLKIRSGVVSFVSVVRGLFP